VNSNRAAHDDASAALVFGIGLCALVGAQQTLIMRGVGAGSTRAGFTRERADKARIGRGFKPLLRFCKCPANRPRATAVMGLILSIIGLCLFVIVLARLRG
jgi:hypothetical protein